MAFKESLPQFKLIDVRLIDPDPDHPRKSIDAGSLKGLANSIKSKGVIQPVIVQPLNEAGRHVLIVGERRWRAALLAGEAAIPALVRACDPAEALEIQVFENLGLGVRSPLETREMAHAIQKISERFESQEAAAEHFGRPPSWLSQATAAANLSPKVSALLESGQISSCTTAIQLEKLSRKNEARAETLIGHLEAGEKLAKEVVADALSDEGGRRKKKAAREKPEPAITAVSPAAADEAAATPPADLVDLPWEVDQPPAPRPASSASARRVNPGKVRQVAEILGLADGDEEEVLALLIDEFLRLKGGLANRQP